jgi:hypothetical protein
MTEKITITLSTGSFRVVDTLHAREVVVARVAIGRPG